MTTYSSNRDHNGSFLVYINKIEVPAISVNIKYGIWNIPQATITLAPDPVLQRIGAEDRVQVQVFFLDDFLLASAGEEAIPRIIMEGEIVGWNYQVVPGSRAISFTLYNQMQIFSQLYLQLLTNYDEMAAGAITQKQNPSTLYTPQNEIVFPFSLFTQGLVGGKQIKRPFDFLYNVVKSMVAKDMSPQSKDQNFDAIPSDYRSVPAANFFTRWARMTNFINRFVATPVFDETSESKYDYDKADAKIFPILKQVQETAGIEVLTRSLLGPIQHSGSLWDFIQIVYTTMLEEVAMIPTAPLVSVNLSDSTIQPTNFKSHQVATVKKQTKAVTPAESHPQQPLRLANYFAKPQFFFGLPPACNVVFPSMIEMYNFSEMYDSQATRMYFSDEVISDLLKINGTLEPAVLTALSVAYPPAANGFQIAKKDDPRATGKNFLLFPEEFYKGPVMDRRTLPTWLYFLKMADKSNKTTYGYSGEIPKTVDPTSGTPIPVPAAADGYSYIQETDPDVYALYAEYEYYRERYSRRSGAVICKFNPFIVPGFPAAIFDNRASRVDIFCYVQRVEHSMGPRQMQTTISFLYGRTFQEMFNIMSTDMAAGATVTATGPREPIKVIRDTIQQFDAAEDFYRALFFGRAAMPKGKDAAMDWRKIIAYRATPPAKSPEAIYLNGTTDAAKTAYNKAVAAAGAVEAQQVLVECALMNAKASVTALTQEFADIDKLAVIDAGEHARVAALLAEAQQHVIDREKDEVMLRNERAKYDATLNNPDLHENLFASHNLNNAKVFELIPTNAFEAAFESFDAAMNYVWRPICSLDEYIIFTGATAENPIPAFGTPFSIGAQYYERIGRMNPLKPDFPFPYEAQGIAKDTGTTAVASVPAVGGNFPNTRDDWDTPLLEYRNNVYLAKVPRG